MHLHGNISKNIILQCTNEVTLDTTSVKFKNEQEYCIMFLATYIQSKRKHECWEYAPCWWIFQWFLIVPKVIIKMFSIGPRALHDLISANISRLSNITLLAPCAPALPIFSQALKCVMLQLWGLCTCRFFFLGY